MAMRRMTKHQIKRREARRRLRPWEVIAVLLQNKQLRVINRYGGVLGNDELTAALRAIIVCPRTGQEITLENVRRIQVEHWPVAYEHGGPTSPDNAIISLREGHMEHTARETQGRGKERRLQIARKAKAEIEQHIGKKPKWRLKKKVGGGVVRVRTK
jgi:hypothetical protein